jgi:hypothetical protein
VGGSHPPVLMSLAECLSASQLSVYSLVPITFGITGQFQLHHFLGELV